MSRNKKPNAADLESFADQIIEDSVLFLKHHCTSGKEADELASVLSLSSDMVRKMKQGQGTLRNWLKVYAYYLNLKKASAKNLKMAISTNFPISDADKAYFQLKERLNISESEAFITIKCMEAAIEIKKDLENSLKKKRKR